MSENYQYAECKHCGKSIMEGEIHNCRQMLLAEIADCHATMLRQAKNINKLHDEVGRLRSALESIRDFEKNSGLITTWRDAFSRLVEIAREALADRP